MQPTGSRSAARSPHPFLAALLVLIPGCTSQDPLLAFLDDQSNVSFTHPPRWSVGSAEQQGVRYRYVTAPKLPGDAEALSATMIAPTSAESAAAVAEAYLAGASEVVPANGPGNASAWKFRDSSRVASRLQISAAGPGRFFGAWVRGSDAAMNRYSSRVDALLASLRLEEPAQWPEERFAGLIARVPAAWTRGSRLASATQATMQFKSPPLFVETGSSTIHGFLTVSREPVPPPGDLDAFAKLLKSRTSDTVALIEHHPWLALEGVDRAPGYVDYMRSGTTLTSNRIRRWITVRNGTGLAFSCEARADAFERLDPWCRRVAYTVRLE